MEVYKKVKLELIIGGEIPEEYLDKPIPSNTEILEAIQGTLEEEIGSDLSCEWLDCSVEDYDGKK